jgi:hypothetical protein
MFSSTAAEFTSRIQHGCHLNSTGFILSSVVVIGTRERGNAVRHTAAREFQSRFIHMAAFVNSL